MLANNPDATPQERAELDRLCRRIGIATLTVLAEETDAKLGPGHFAALQRNTHQLTDEWLRALADGRIVAIVDAARVYAACVQGFGWGAEAPATFMEATQGLVAAVTAFPEEDPT